MAHVGKAKDGNTINGILKPVNTKVKSKGGTSAGINSTRVVYVAEMVVPSNVDNKNAVLVERVINDLVEQKDGDTFELGGGTVLWEFELGTPKDYAVRDGVGSSIPMAFTVYATFTDNTLLNGVKVWTLDGNPIPYTGEGVVLNKDGRIIPIYEYKNQQGIMTGQHKLYKFRIPYDKDNVVCTTLQNDILNGDFRKRYTLGYSDGVIDGFTTTVCLYQTGDMSTQQSGDPTDIVVSFIDAGKNSFDIGNNTTIEYNIALIDWDFDNTSENTLWFESQAAQQAYISDGSSLADSIVNDPTKSTLYMPFYAPNLGTQLNTHVDVDCTWAYDWSTAATHNYAVVRKTKTVTTNNTPTTTNEYFYYWVLNPQFGANGMLSMDLQMDTLQTYMFDDDLEIPDCMIERAHLNRWEEKVGDTSKVIFENSINSPILLGEANIGDSGKTCTARQMLKFKWTSSQTVNDWIHTNIAYWVYAYVDITGMSYIIDNYNSNATIDGVDTAVSINSFDGSIYQYPYGVFCYPVYRGNSKKIKYLKNYPGVSAVSKNIDIDDFSNFLSRNNGTSHVFCMKASIIPPFAGCTYFAPYTTEQTTSEGNELYIDNDGNLIFEQSNSAAITDGYISFTDNIGDLCCRMTTSSDMGNTINLFTAPQQIKQWFTSYNQNNFTMPVFSKSSIIGSNHNILYNPKMLQKNFVEYKLKDAAGFSYTYDKSKAKTEATNAQFAYSEALQPEITRYYCRYLASEPIYTLYMFENYTGLAGSMDTTLSMATDSYDNFIANNRNFWLQTLLGFGLNVAGSGLRSGNPITGIANTGLSLFDSAFALSDRLFTQSNLEQSPDSIRNTSGSVLGNLQISNLGIYLETWDAYDTTKQTADQYMNMNGFLYNQLDSLLNWLHTRKYFNYIKAEIVDIQGVPLTNEIRNDIKQRFANGVRFWDATTFATNGVQYDKENYELWLETPATPSNSSS